MPDDVNRLRSDVLSPIGKLVFQAFASNAMGTNRPVSMSDGDIAKRCGVSRPSVIGAIERLLALGLIEKVGPPRKQIQAYRICHQLFASPAGVSESEETPAIWKAGCLKCHREVRRLTRAGYCRGCHKDEEMLAKVRQVQYTHPGIEAEEIAVILKDQHQLHRMTARVRRILRQSA